VSAVGAADGVAEVVGRGGGSMSFMGTSLPGGQPDVVSPWTAFRLHPRRHGHSSSVAPAGCARIPWEYA
jgi:hypothetical protein